MSAVLKGVLKGVLDTGLFRKPIGSLKTIDLEDGYYEFTINPLALGIVGEEDYSVVVRGFRDNIYILGIGYDTGSACWTVSDKYMHLFNGYNGRTSAYIDLNAGGNFPYYDDKRVMIFTYAGNGQSIRQSGLIEIYSQDHQFIKSYSTYPPSNTAMPTPSSAILRIGVNKAEYNLLTVLSEVLIYDRVLDASDRGEIISGEALDPVVHVKVIDFEMVDIISGVTGTLTGTAEFL